MSGDQGPSHEFIDHTSELGLRLHGRDLTSIFRQAVVALAQLLDPASGDQTGHETHDVVVTASDGVSLLVEWLNELIFLAESRCWCPLTADVRRLSSTEIVARVSGAKLDRAPAFVKAATYHGAHVTQTDDTWSAEVIFDI